MTQIGVITIDVPVDYMFNDQSVTMNGIIETDCDCPEALHSLRELFTRSYYGTTIHSSIGRKPVGEDMDADRRNTQYVQFTHGDRPSTGWYLLEAFNMFQDVTPLGFAYNFAVTVFFKGTKSYYQPGYAVDDMGDVEEELEANDWGI